VKKFLVIFSIVTVIATTTFFVDKVYAQGGDLCGGTSGNGQIVSMGSNTFTLKLNENDDLIVNFTDRTMIETPIGYAQASDLKIGDRVTLVGDKHHDGTFTADTVVVCSGMEAIKTGDNTADQTTPISVQNKNPETYEKVNSLINTVAILLVGLIWLGIVVFLLLKKKKGFVYVLFFTIFYIYLYKVLDYTIIQFQSLLLLQHFVPDLMLNGFRDGTNVNLIPLATLTLEDLKTSLLNILMMMPFGFGLPFVTDFRFKKVLIIGLLFSISIEILQFVTGYMANTTFRVADINDLIFNTIGVAIGYMLFVIFIRFLRRIFPHYKTSITSIVK
jgi:glycopeptide antibiotics resistance protein